MSHVRCNVCRRTISGPSAVACDPACALVIIASELEERHCALVVARDLAESEGVRNGLETAMERMMDARHALISIAARTSKRELFPCPGADENGCPLREQLDHDHDCALCSASQNQQYLMHFAARVDEAADRAQLRYAAAMRDAGRAHLLRPEER